MDHSGISSVIEVQESVSMGGSDHRPVRVDLDIDVQVDES